jgi:hypothetical protein
MKSNLSLSLSLIAAVASITQVAQVAGAQNEPQVPIPRTVTWRWRGRTRASMSTAHALDLAAGIQQRLERRALRPFRGHTKNPVVWRGHRAMRQHRFVFQWRQGERIDLACLFGCRQRNTVSPDVWQPGHSPPGPERPHARLYPTARLIGAGPRFGRSPCAQSFDGIGGRRR